MGIQLKIQLIGTFQKFYGKRYVDMKFATPVPVSIVIQKLTNVSKDLKRELIDPVLDDPRPNAIILINGKEIGVLRGLETIVHDDDEIIILQISHGG